MKLDKLKRVVIKEEYVALTGNSTSALILNQLIYWSQRTRDFDKFIIEEKIRYENEGKKIEFNLQEGWIYKSYDELKDELMLSESAKTLGRHINKLIENKFIDRRRNPKIKYDRKYQYRVNLIKIKLELNKLGYDLQDYKVSFPKGQIDDSKEQNDSIENSNCTFNGHPDHSNGNFTDSKMISDPSKSHDVQTIPETTIDITTENTLETTTTTKKNSVDVVLSNKNINSDFEKTVNNISNTFSSITDKKVNSNDITSIKDILVTKKYEYISLKDKTVIKDILVTKKYEYISLKDKTVIINRTISTINNDFKKRNPNEKINSFNYFLKAIEKEFKNLEASNKGDESIDRSTKNETYVDEYGRKYDFSALTTNR